MKSKPSFFRHCLPRLSAIGVSLVLSGPFAAAVAEPNILEQLDEMVFATLDECADCPIRQILVRVDPESFTGQMDVAIGERVVSFVTAQSVGQRAWCEMVYVNEESWFGTCALYDVAFGSFQDLMTSFLTCDDCKVHTKYGLGARDQGCGPGFVVKGKGSKVTMETGLQWVLELTGWDPKDAEALREALRVVGFYGCPWLGRDLIEFFALEPFGNFSDEDLYTVEEIPRSIATLMNHQQSSGLVRLLEHQVDRIPGEAPRRVSPQWRSEPVILDVNGWSGTLPESEEHFVVDVSEVTTDGVALMVGGVNDAFGTTMAFLVPTSGEALISSTWASTSLVEDAAFTLWSDGNCEHVALRITQSPVDLDKRAPWLGWAVSPADVFALSDLQRGGDETWPVGEMWLGLGSFHPQNGEDFEVEITRTDSNSLFEQPEMLQQYWSEIVDRFVRARERLERAEELRFVAASGP